MAANPVGPSPAQVPPAEAPDELALLEREYGELAARVAKDRPKDDLAPLRKAFEFALRLHAGQRRDSGEPYLLHPLQVAAILAAMHVDLTCLVTALLHDVVEDTPTTLEEIIKQFGPDVARCVDGVTKLSKIHFYSREDRQAESVRKMLLAMTTDIRVVLVKLADRIHNCRTLSGIKDPERRKRIAQETLDIYAPIANRLGMGKVRSELEDLAFEHTEPEAYRDIIEQIEKHRKANDDFLNRIKRIVEEKLREEHVPARVDARLKRAYSVYVKLKKQKISIDQVYDLMAFRIVTGSVKDCYGALGVIHSEWHPIPGRIKDFIAIPRPNLYQSLHTSVMGPEGQPFEVQIRTEEMHKVAEEGIAAHWRYKEGKKGDGIDADDQRIAWLRQLVEWQRDMRDPGDFMSTLKVDLASEEVYSFTPNGKVIVLPREATPVDFAYAVHSQVGNNCVGAKANGRIVPLKYHIKNGDVIEILTQPNHMPSKDWLGYVKTSKARNKIKHEINTTERAKAIEIGQKYLEKEARRLSVPLSKVTKARMEEVAGEYGYSKIDDLHAALGYGKYSARQVLHKLAPEEVAESEPAPAAEPVAPTPNRPGMPDGDKDLVITVDGVDDLLVYLSKCCNPIRGEPIVGYVTRGKGIGVHAKTCKNVLNLIYEPERKVSVEWSRAAAKTFSVKVVIYTDDRPGMLNQFTSVLFQEGSNIRSLEARADEGRGDGAIVDVTTEIKDKKQLEKIMSAIRRISGVRDIERVQ
jgi:GTP diphosphokinase / guanosine-3',5'-bis(diphosphate) 3'-diphosphatase